MSHVTSEALTPPNVVAVLQLSPPITGLTAMNERMVQRLRAAGKLHDVVDLSAPVASGRFGKIAARVLRTMGAIRSLVAARKQGCEALYMPCDGGLGMIYNGIVMAAARLLRYRVWLHHHSFAYINATSLLMWALIALSPKYTTHVALCSTMLESLARRYSRIWSRRSAKGWVLSNAFGVEIDAGVAATKPRPASGITIGHLSNLTEQKGSLRFIAVFEALRAAGVPARAKMAGPIGDTPTATGVEAARHRHGEAFEWYGPVSGASKTAFFDAIDAFVFPSDYANEAQPVVLLEALAHGASILATERGCMACDHVESPGLIAPLEAFHDAAVAWLVTASECSHEGPAKSLAREAFYRARATSEMQLAGLIETMAPTRRKR